MPAHIDNQQLRSSSSREDFAHCPKYLEHDLSKDQTKELIEEIVEVVIAKLDSPDRRKELLKEIYKDMKADAFDEGKGAIYRLVVLIGFVAMAAYSWLSNHPIK